MAEIYNDTSNKIITGTSAADSIRNFGDLVSIIAGAGNDSVYSYGSYKSKIDGGKGNDYILQGWNTDDTSFSDNSTLAGGDGDDTVYNYGSAFVSIAGGDGNDYIRNLNVTEWNSATERYETLGSPDNVTISGGAGDDTIYNYNGDKASIAGGAGDDTIHNGGNNVTIAGGAGNDTVNNSGDNVTISGGKGNDTVNNSGDNVTISGGKGNDCVYNFGVGTAYVYSAGNDTLYDFDDLSSIVLGSVKVKSSVRSGSTITLNLNNDKTLTLKYYQAEKINVVKTLADVRSFNIIRNNYDGSTEVMGTAQDDCIMNETDGAKITAGKGDDAIRNYKSQVTIDGGAGDDSIYNGDRNVSINAGAGFDTVDNYGSQNTILGGTGDDSIKNNSNNVLIDAGKGKDTITVSGHRSTVTGGKDGDKIYLSSTSNVIKYKSGDGNDTIYGFNSTDSLSISGADYSTLQSGDDILVTVGKGKILLKDVLGNAIYINKKNVAGKSTDKNFIVLTTGADSLSNDLDNVTISGEAGNDSIVNSGSNVKINAGDGNDYIVSYDSDNVSINTSAGNDSIYNSRSSNFVFVYKSGDGNDSILGFNETSTLSVVGKKYSTKTSGDNVIVTVDKGKITLEGAASLSAVNVDFSKLLTVTNKTSSPVKIDSDIKVVDASSRTTAVKITGNAKANSILGGAGADTLQGGKGKDTLWGGAGNDKLYGGAGSDTFIYKPNEGTDTIYDWEAGDLLQILNTDGGQGAFTNSAFKNSKLTLTIDGGGKVVFSGVSASDAFNINGTSYQISGSKLK